MHRQILGLEVDDPRQGDHIETGHTLDNRRKNLRIATGQQNQFNRRKYRTNKTGYKGVSKKGNGYVASMTQDGKHVYLGYRSTPEAAYFLYVAAVRCRGEFGRTE
jgi:hypothetical protein